VEIGLIDGGVLQICEDRVDDLLMTIAPGKLSVGLGEVCNGGESGRKIRNKLTKKVDGAYYTAYSSNVSWSWKFLKEGEISGGGLEGVMGYLVTEIGYCGAKKMAFCDIDGKPMFRQNREDHLEVGVMGSIRVRMNKYIVKKNLHVLEILEESSHDLLEVHGCPRKTEGKTELLEMAKWEDESGQGTCFR
jgi:hypothetical protein